MTFDHIYGFWFLTKWSVRCVLSSLSVWGLLTKYLNHIFDVVIRLSTRWLNGIFDEVSFWPPLNRKWSWQFKWILKIKIIKKITKIQMDIDNKRMIKTGQIDFFKIKEWKRSGLTKSIMKIKECEISLHINRSLILTWVQNIYEWSWFYFFDRKWPIIQEKKIAETEY